MINYGKLFSLMEGEKALAEIKRSGDFDVLRRHFVEDAAESLLGKELIDWVVQEGQVLAERLLGENPLTSVRSLSQKIEANITRLPRYNELMEGLIKQVLESKEAETKMEQSINKKE